MTKRVGVTLRLQRVNGIVKSSSGPGQYMVWEIARHMEACRRALAARKQRLHLAGANREPCYLLPNFRFCARVFVGTKEKGHGWDRGLIFDPAFGWSLRGKADVATRIIPCFHSRSRLQFPNGAIRRMMELFYEQPYLRVDRCLWPEIYVLHLAAPP